jgi:hypothetical protein
VAGAGGFQVGGHAGRVEGGVVVLQEGAAVPSVAVVGVYGEEREVVVCLVVGVVGVPGLVEGPEPVQELPDDHRQLALVVVDARRWGAVIGVPECDRGQLAANIDDLDLAVVEGVLDL